MFQYWIDFFGAIWELVRTVFIGLTIVIVILVIIELVPFWVLLILFGVFLLYLYAHSVAIDKQDHRKRIDADIEAWKERIKQEEKVIISMYQCIANAELDEDTRRYVLTIERAEEVIERAEKKIKQLLLQRSCV